MEKTKYELYPDGTWMDAYRIVWNGALNNVPAFIIEHCYMDNRADFQEFLSDDEKLKALGVADAIGLARALGLEEKSQRPPEYPSSLENGDTPFDDVCENHWYYDDVTYAYQNGLMQGIEEHWFRPRWGATRAMVVTLLYRIDGGGDIAQSISFEDVSPESWYYNEVEWAYAGGVTTGVAENLFCPEQTVTREQFVTFLYRYAQRKHYDVQAGQELSGFDDADKVSGYAVEPMVWASEKGLIQGYEDGTIRPDRELNRSELAALMHRFHSYLLTEEPEEPEVTDPTEPIEPTEPTVPVDPTQPSELPPQS